MLKRYTFLFILSGLIALLAARIYTHRESAALFSLDYWQSVHRYAQVMRIANAHYVEGEAVDFSAFTDRALREGLRSLDRYSDYFTPTDFDAFEMASRQEYFGIGIEINQRSGDLLITAVFAGGPAAEAGLQVGDIIVAVDEKAIEGMELFDIVSRIRGVSGTTVQLELQRIGQEAPEVVEVERGRIALDAVVDAEIVAESIGYLRVRQFTDALPVQLATAIDGLAEEGISGLILDLRDNPGGVLDIAVEVAALFLPEGKSVVSIEERLRAPRVFTTPRGSGRFDFPLVVLINGNSASAAEIIAGAMRDHERATTVGQTTFGKGSVQGVFSLRGGDGLRLTTARYLLPGGEAIDGVGVVPDVVVDVNGVEEARYYLETRHLSYMDAERFEQVFGFEPGDDTTFQRGLEHLQSVLAGETANKAD